MKKYGYSVASKNPNIKKKIWKSCSKTNLEKYGVTSTFLLDSFKEKTKKRNRKKYGCDNFSLAHLSENARKILLDKNLFKEELIQNGVDGLALKLGVCQNTIYKRHIRYALNIITPTTSSFESEIDKWLISKNIKFEKRNRKMIAPFELDFYIPSHNLAIEFDGLYWHSESLGKDKFYHANKTKMANEKGIRLIHIFEDEWVNHKEVCLDLLSRFLNLPSIIIPARKCKISVINSRNCAMFLEKNHLQGKASSTINLGLFYNENLVQVLTFKHSRYTRKIQWENIRCCSLMGHKIIGGTKKLWAYFLKHYHPESVVSYCDRRWFSGETYDSLNFKISHTTPPQYSYTDYNSRFHRSSYTKSKCIKRALLLDGTSKMQIEKMTEKQIAYEILHLDRVWDCGLNSWVWKNDN